MTHDRQSKLPLPVEVTEILLHTSPAAPSHAVLELRTPTNPARFFLTRPQLEELAKKARTAAAKLFEGHMS
jgi:hypothetical protein